MSCKSSCCEPPLDPEIRLYRSYRVAGRDKCGYIQFRATPNTPKTEAEAPFSPEPPTNLFSDDEDEVLGPPIPVCGPPGGEDTAAGSNSLVRRVFKQQRTWSSHIGSSTSTGTETEESFNPGQVTTVTTTLNEYCEQVSVVDPATCAATHGEMVGETESIEVVTRENSEDPEAPCKNFTATIRTVTPCPGGPTVVESDLPVGCGGYIGGCYSGPQLTEAPVADETFESPTLRQYTYRSEPGADSVEINPLCEASIEGSFIRQNGIELSDEFTTAELAELAEGDLESAEWTDWEETIPGESNEPFAARQISPDEYSIALGESYFKITHNASPTGYLKVWFGVMINSTAPDSIDADVDGPVYEWTGTQQLPIPRIDSAEYLGEAFGIQHEGQYLRRVFVKKWSYLPDYEPGDGEPNGVPPDGTP